jgi:hypothetical protein
MKRFAQLASIALVLVAVTALPLLSQYNCTYKCNPWAGCVGTSWSCDNYGCVNDSTMNCSLFVRTEFAVSPPYEHTSGGNVRVVSVTSDVFCKRTSGCANNAVYSMRRCRGSALGYETCQDSESIFDVCAVCSPSTLWLNWVASHADCTTSGCGL